MNLYITYNQFILNKYNKRGESLKLAGVYLNDGGFKKYKTAYIKNNGFANYLLHIQGNALDLKQSYALGKLFYVYDKRSPSTLPMLLAAIQKQYQLTMPEEQGLLTKAFWQSRFDDALFS